MARDSRLWACKAAERHHAKTGHAMAITIFGPGLIWASCGDCLWIARQGELDGEPIRRLQQGNQIVVERGEDDE